VKDYVDYMVRWSAIHTLAGKHKSSSRKIIAKYTKNLVIRDEKEYIVAELMSSNKIRAMGRKFLTDVSEDAFDKVIDAIWVKFSRSKFFGIRCAVRGCSNSDIEMHHVRELARMKDTFGHISVVSKKGRRVTGTEAFKVAFNRKQIPLCHSHHVDSHNKRLAFWDIDWEYVRGDGIF